MILTTKQTQVKKGKKLEAGFQKRWNTYTSNKQKASSIWALKRQQQQKQQLFKPQKVKLKLKPAGTFSKKAFYRWRENSKLLIFTF